MKRRLDQRTSPDAVWAVFSLISQVVLGVASGISRLNPVDCPTLIDVRTVELTLEVDSKLPVTELDAATSKGKFASAVCPADCPSVFEFVCREAAAGRGSSSGLRLPHIDIPGGLG